jgi:hypothetical protein
MKLFPVIFRNGDAKRRPKAAARAPTLNVDRVGILFSFFPPFGLVKLEIQQFERDGFKGRLAIRAEGLEIGFEPCD